MKRLDKLSLITLIATDTILGIIAILGIISKVLGTKNMLFEAKVKYNGNHYFAGQTVRGSKLERRYTPNKGWTYWIFDDEPIESFPYYGEGRDEWVEIDKSTLIEYK